MIRKLVRGALGLAYTPVAIVGRAMAATWYQEALRRERERLQEARAQLVAARRRLQELDVQWTGAQWQQADLRRQLDDALKAAQAADDRSRMLEHLIERAVKILGSIDPARAHLAWRILRGQE